MALVIRAQFPDLFLSSMLPALDEVIFQQFNPRPPQFSRIFRVLSSTRSIEQTSQVSGLGLPYTIPENGKMRYDASVPGFSKTYQHEQAGLGFMASRIMADDDKHNLIKEMASELGRSVREYLEIRVASHFNNGFSGSYLGPDGVSLFSASHPLVKAGGTQSNVLSAAADLDIGSLELMLTGFRKLTDSAGKKVRVRPARLLVPPEGEFIASELLGGQMRADTANHTINAFRNRDTENSFTDFMVWDYLTDPDAFFVVGEPRDTQLRFYWREKPNTVHDIDFDTRSVKTAMWLRWSSGWSDYYGVYGTPGV